GPDCLPCTADDAAVAAPQFVPLSTAVAEAAIFDVDSDGTGARLDYDTNCGAAPCTTRATGSPFDCGSLTAGGNASTAVLAGAFPSVDGPLVGDGVITLRLVGAAFANPTMTPTPTRTFPPPTRTGTHTRTPSSTPPNTATATVPSAQGSLILRRASLRANTGDEPAAEGGRISLAGVVNTNPPFASLIDDITAGGVRLSVQTAGGVDVLVVWEAAECWERPSARGPTITCEGRAGDPRRRLRLRPLAIPNLFRLTIQVRGLGFAPPLSADPVRATLTTASLIRPGEIGDCRVLGRRQHVQRCRESGVLPTATAIASPTVVLTPTHATEAPTSTITPTWTRTPTQTRTPLDLPPGSLGVRVYTLSSGNLLTPPSAPGSGLFTSVLGGANIATTFAPGPLRLIGGVPGVDGIAPLRLAD
ncbi:MAG: hypothetical protein ACREJT_08530, partial [Myxococcota bacterium]